MHATTKACRHEPVTAATLAIDLVKDVFEPAFADAAGVSPSAGDSSAGRLRRARGIVRRCAW